VQGDDLRVVDGSAAGAWIRPRLSGEFGAVTHQVPQGFDAYARIFHRASDQEGRPARWSDVAAAMGTTAHREMQWYALIGSPDPCTYDDSRWPGNGPMTGELDEPQLDALCEILAAHTGEPENCLFGLCTIELWEESFTRDELKKNPLLRLPLGRDHIVLAGPLSAIDQLDNDGKANPGPSRGSFTAVSHSDLQGEEAPQLEPNSLGPLGGHDAPSLIWPADRSWLVASEVDFDSTLVGGDRDLIQAILAAPELEAWEVEPDDSLVCDADKVNAMSKEPG